MWIAAAPAAGAALVYSDLMNPRPRLLQELGEVRSLFFRFAVVLLVLAVLMLVGSPSLAMLAFAAMKAMLLPPGVTVVALGPLSSFVAPISVAFMAALIISFPYLLFSLLRYILPALYPAERRTVSSLFFSSLVLFFVGCAFAYFVLIPYTFAILYSFAGPLGVTPFFSLDSFIAGVFGLTISAGIAFLVPIVMILLSAIDLVPARLWRSHWRAAVLTVVIFSAVITPDGSGVTMVILSVPLLLLYGMGVLESSRRARSGVLPPGSLV